MINNIQYAVNEARAASRVDHPGLIGRIRELAADKIFRPVLPAAFALGTGKIVDRNTSLSAEVDLVIYNRDLLPPIMYSDRDGIFPVESIYYTFEIKSESSAANIRDAINKQRQLIALDHSKKEIYNGNKSPAVPVFFAFNSDLSPDGKTELARYMELDPDWKEDPIIKVICVVGRGYWNFSIKDKAWHYLAATQTFDEVLILLSHTVNTLMPKPFTRSHLKNPLYFLSSFGTVYAWHEKKNYQTSNGQSSNPLFQGHQYGKTEKADHGAQTGKSSMASSGYFVPEPAGMIYPNDFHPIRPATGDYRNGSAQECSEVSWRRLPLICETVASSISANVL